MDPMTLLAELEPLTHAARVRRLVDLGRAAATDPAIKSCLFALRESDHTYERLLFLHSLHGSRDGAAAVAALDDPSRSVRRLAAKVLPLIGDDEQVGLALSGVVERSLRGRLVAALVRRRRVAAIDAFLGRRLSQGRDPQAIDLLPYGSTAAVRAHWRWMTEAASPLTWARLARHHAAFCAAQLTAGLVTGAGGLEPRQRWRVLPLLPTLSAYAPDETLTLVRALFDHQEQPATLGPALQPLLQRRPQQTFDLLRVRHESARPDHPPGAFGVVRFDHVAHRLGRDRLVYLIEHAYGALSDGARGRAWFLRLDAADREAALDTWLERGRGSWGAFLLRHVPAQGPSAEARERAYQRWSHATRDRDGAILLQQVGFLPRDLRIREARRHLHDLPALTSKPLQRLPYAQLLPFAEARTQLQPWLGHPEGEERARALSILLRCIENDAAATGEALAVVRARKFEQDPVRLAMLGALSQLPVRCFQPEHLTEVGAIVQDALDAADLSSATAAAAERLVARLFRVDGAFGARWLTRLLEVRGHVSTYGLGVGLTAAQVSALAPHLSDLAERWASRERAGALLLLAQSLGLRLAQVPALLDGLARLCRELPFVGVAAGALALLKARARARFIALVPELLGTDKSFALLPIVARYVSLRRQDLLSPLLSATPMTGRFASGRTHWVVDFGAGQGRWTQAQQRAYAEGLLALLRDQARDVPALRFAITTLARLAFADASAILPFAADPRPPLREIAVRALPWLDAGQGVPVLIECLGDDRARYAIYALRKSFAEMPRERVLAQLRAVPTGKVTVAKEMVRLYGELGGEDAYRELLALDRRVPPLHRDVRIALLRALWDHLERDETWAVLGRAAADPDWVLASRLADLPLGRLSLEAEDRVVALLAQILGRPEPEARLALLARAPSLPLSDQRRALFQRLLQHTGVAHPDEAAAALGAVLERMRPGEIDQVTARLAELISRRRLLVAFLPVVLARTGPYQPAHRVKVAEGLMRTLAGDPLAVVPHLQLAAKLLPWDALAEALQRLSAQDLLHADAMVAALAAVQGSLHPDLLERRLARQGDPRLRRLALEALLAAARPERGWTPERRQRLEAYGRDPVPGIAGPAAFVFPPE